MTITATGIASRLRENQQPDGCIRDPLHGDCGTYAGGMAALAFGLAAIHTGDTAWAEACRLSARAAQQRPLSPSSTSWHLLPLTHEECKAGGPVTVREPAVLYLAGAWSPTHLVAMRALNHSPARAPEQERCA